MRKMISSTSMTSTSGVVLMSDIGASSPPSLGPTLMAMFRILSWQIACKADGGGGAAPSPPGPRQAGSDLLRARGGGAGGAAGGGGRRTGAARGRNHDRRLHRAAGDHV